MSAYVLPPSQKPGIYGMRRKNISRINSLLYFHLKSFRQRKVDWCFLTHAWTQIKLDFTKRWRWEKPISSFFFSDNCVSSPFFCVESWAIREGRLLLLPETWKGTNWLSFFLSFFFRECTCTCSCLKVNWQTDRQTDRQADRLRLRLRLRLSIFHNHNATIYGT